MILSCHIGCSSGIFRNPQHRIIFNRRKIRSILRRWKPDLIEVDCASKLAGIARSAFPGDTAPPIVGFYHVHLPTFFAREAGKHMDELDNRIQAVLERGRQSGELRSDLPVKSTAAFLRNSYEGLVVSSAVNRDPEHLAVNTECALRLLD